MEEPLPRGFAEMVGHQDQDQDPHEIGEDRDRQDEQRDRSESCPVRLVAQIGIEQADRDKVMIEFSPAQAAATSN